MKNNILLTVLMLTALTGCYSSNMKITSSAFGHNQSIPSKYTCDEDNTNPPLEFSDLPEGTVSLALIMDDPDVPKHLRPDGNWDHWLVWNIPGDTTGIPEATVAPGVTGKNTGETNKYQGPCPPDREHRYFFKLYALDTMLELDPQTTTKADIEQAMDGHTLDKAELIGLYNRQ